MNFRDHNRVMQKIDEIVRHCAMCNALGYPVDPYRMLAKEMFPVGYEGVTEAQRSWAKISAYTVIYGQWPAVL